MRPDKDPWVALASALDYTLYPEVPRHERDQRREEIAADLKRDPQNLTDRLVEFGNNNRGVEKVLILVNQFEELFTLAGHGKNNVDNDDDVASAKGEGRKTKQPKRDFRDLMVEDVVNHAAFSPDGSRIVTASSDKIAKVWDAATGTMIHELKGHVGNINHAVFSPDGSRIVTASSDKKIGRASCRERV